MHGGLLGRTRDVKEHRTLEVTAASRHLSIAHRPAFMLSDRSGYLQSSRPHPRRETPWFCIPCWAAWPPAGQRSSVFGWLRQRRLSCSPHDHSLSHPATHTRFNSPCIFSSGHSPLMYSSMKTAELYITMETAELKSSWYYTATSI